MIATVRDAIDAGRVDLYLQPIVTLPQRKVRYYEAFTRLRTADGAVLQPSEFLDAAEAGGLMPRIDQLLLFRSVQVVRRLQLKNREIGLFCNIAASTLNDPQLFPEILQFMDANRALALVAHGGTAAEHAARHGPAGNRKPRGAARARLPVLHGRRDGSAHGAARPRRARHPLRQGGGVVPAGRGRAQPAPTSTPPTCPTCSAAIGISLIAERIEGETQVVDLLEYDVRFGQGFLFSQPRPVRAEALRGAAETDEAAAQDDADMPRKVAAGGSGAAL